ncbi:copper resistance protein CopC [Sphingomonas sp.]|jgi:methionine-rich copper-binding protein CopC|uniref:copper resistance protein CopC n=1 Tax=Sphingomonas sp. TaxID=28214 RepID=UPI0035C7E898
MRLFPAALILSLLPAAPVIAQPTLASATPAADTVVARPTRLTLAFSEPVTAAADAIDLVMTAMPGMKDHPPMPIRGFATTTGADRRSLVAVLPRPLPAGSYRLRWRVTGSDGATVEGQYAFSAR